MPGHKSPLRSQGKPPMMVRVRCHIFQKKNLERGCEMEDCIMLYSICWGMIEFQGVRMGVSLEVSKSPPGGPETCPSESSPEGMLEDSGFGQK